MNLLWEQEVGSSNLLAPTHKAFRSNELRKAFFLVVMGEKTLCYAGATLGRFFVFRVDSATSAQKNPAGRKPPGVVANRLEEYGLEVERSFLDDMIMDCAELISYK